MAAMADLRQSPAYAEYLKRIGWRVEKIGGVNVFIRSLGIAKIQRADVPVSFPKIPGIWMTKLEPLSLGQVPRGFRQDGWPLLATKTLRVDLTPPLAEILAGFAKDCRYCLRKSQTTNLKSQLNDFEGFYDLWKKAAKIKHLWIPPPKHFAALVECFGNNCLCITINNLAGALALIHDQVAYYYYAAALPEAKKSYLPYTGVWELIRAAKKRGCKVWDWEGIYDPRWPNKSWLGFTHFKKSFGGYEVLLPGSFTRWF